MSSFRCQADGGSMISLLFPHIHGAVCMGSCWGCSCGGIVQVARKAACSPSTALHCTSPFCTHSKCVPAQPQRAGYSPSFVRRNVLKCYIYILGNDPKPQQMVLLAAGFQSVGNFSHQITVQRRKNIYACGLLHILRDYKLRQSSLCSLFFLYRPIIYFQWGSMGKGVSLLWHSIFALDYVYRSYKVILVCFKDSQHHTEKACTVQTG